MVDMATLVDIATFFITVMLLAEEWKTFCLYQH